MFKNVARTWNDLRILMMAWVLLPGPSSKVSATVFFGPETDGAVLSAPTETGGHDGDETDVVDAIVALDPIVDPIVRPSIATALARRAASGFVANMVQA
jgi:hypothetical protein